MKQLREVGELLNLGCGDGSCYFKRPTGQHTNGGCRCDLAAELRKRQEAIRKLLDAAQAFEPRDPAHADCDCKRCRLLSAAKAVAELT